jgi:hypothetical protein
MKTPQMKRHFLSSAQAGLAAGVALVLSGVATVHTARAGAPPEAEVQGLYEGTGATSGGEFKLEARVVAQGRGTYKVLVRQLHADKIVRVELAGKEAGDTVAFAGKAAGVEWSGLYAAGTIGGKIGQEEAFQLRRVEKKSPTLGVPPPPGAVVLLDGKDFSEMVKGNGNNWYLADMSQNNWTVWEARFYTFSPKDPAEWPTLEQAPPKGWTLNKEHRRADVVIGIDTDGSIQVPRGGMNSKRTFEGGFKLHVEFMNPLMPTEHSQGRGNSGVYLPNGEEIQVLDSFGETTYVGGGCGGLYAYKDPDTMDLIESLKGKSECQYTLASLPPLAWQTFDVEYRVEKKDGKYAGKPRVTVLHNGIKIHDNAALRNDARKGGFQFQDHGNPVRYRNIWVLPL